MSQTNNHDNRFTKIFVGNLTWRTTSYDLRSYFQQFGEVIDANVVRETYPGRSKGYGFVSTFFFLKFILNFLFLISCNYYYKIYLLNEFSYFRIVYIYIDDYDPNYHDCFIIVLFV